MSYTNIISNTRTPAHSIVPENNQTVLEKITNAQGTGVTGDTIRKVAQFIGMSDLPAPTKLVTSGVYSADFELERQQWNASRKITASLEEAERSTRLLDTSAETTKKARAFVLAKSILPMLQTPRKSSAFDRPVSRKFLNYSRKNFTAIEETERERRAADTIGESAKRSLAGLTSRAIVSELQNPSLRSTGHLLNKHRYSSATEYLGMAGAVAMKKLIPAAETFAATAYQIGTFAARAAYFFGGKAAVKAQDLGQQAAVQGQIYGKEAAIKGQEIGQQALAAGQILGEQALEKGQILGQKAVVEAQHLGNKAIDLGNKAAVGAHVLAEKAQTATNNAIAGAQHLGDQASEKATELKQTITAAVADVLDPTLSWKQVSAMEEKERAHRVRKQLGSSRFALALRTSGLVKDLIVSQNVHYNADSEPRKFYGSAILEETERLRRINSKNSRVSKKNAKRTASIIEAYRQQTLARAAAAPAPILVKEVIVQQVAPIRYQAAM